MVAITHQEVRKTFPSATNTGVRRFVGSTAIIAEASANVGKALAESGPVRCRSQRSPSMWCGWMTMAPYGTTAAVATSAARWWVVNFAELEARVALNRSRLRHQVIV